MQEQKPRFSIVYPESCSSRERGEHSVEGALSAHRMVWAGLQGHVQCIMCGIQLTQVQVLECGVVEAGDEGVLFLFLFFLKNLVASASGHSATLFSFIPQAWKCKMYTCKMCTF